MSTLRVGNITATGGTGTITVPTGNQISQVDRPAGLVLIQSASFTTSSGENYSCFSSEFDNYKFILTLTATSVADVGIGMQYGNSGTFSSTTYGNFNGYALSDNTSGAFSQSNFATSSNYLGQAGGDKMPMNSTIEVYQPFLATPTRYTGLAFVTYFSSGVNQRRAALYLAGGHDASTSYSQMRIAPSSGTMTGTIRIYGYRQ